MTEPAADGLADGRLVLIFAHPDDEAFGCAGTMAAATSLGRPATLISATRGERGESSLPGLDDPDLLGAVREQELRAAGAAVGVTDVRFLDAHDSGMAGARANDDPRALVRQPEALVVAKLVVHLRALRPAIVVTFGPDGMYGHPDHIYVSQAVGAAVRLAADPDYLPPAGEPWCSGALYHNSVPREDFLAMLDAPGGPLRELGPEERARFGIPRAAITTWLDVSPWLPAKHRAILAHRTQTGEGGPLAALGGDRLHEFYRRETFVRAGLPWDAGADAGDPLARLVAAASGASSEPRPGPVGSSIQ